MDEEDLQDFPISPIPWREPSPWSIPPQRFPDGTLVYWNENGPYRVVRPEGEGEVDARKKVAEVRGNGGSDPVQGEAVRANETNASDEG
jgi:hypothetical protein